MILTHVQSNHGIIFHPEVAITTTVSCATVVCVLLFCCVVSSILWKFLKFGSNEVYTEGRGMPGIHFALRSRVFRKNYNSYSALSQYVGML